MGDAGLRVALVSLEPWDDVWRRNQHLASHLTGSGAVSRLLFLEPPYLKLGKGTPREPLPGIRVMPLRLRAPKRVGGLVELGRRLRRGILREADLLWVNDPALGVHCLRSGQPAVYDVTDDWRSYPFPPRILRRIVAAEDDLARRASTVVCSAELQRRWRSRYGVEAGIVHNGVDVDAWRTAEAHVFGGPGPHVGYVGTLQSERLDIDLLLTVADDNAVGTVHLVGPNALDEHSRARLEAHPKVKIHPAVPAAEVPSWTKGLDVLLSPHSITPFTLSLDAIKSYEYLASGRPVVATPTSGFQFLSGRAAVTTTSAASFVAAVRNACKSQPSVLPPPGIEWAARAEQFHRALRAASSGV